MTGIVMSGSSFGAIIFPVMIDKLLPTKSFNGAVRVTSYMVVCLLVIANCLMALPTKKWQPKFPPINLIESMKDVHYAAACGGIFIVFLTMWFPQYYIEEFATRHGVNPHLAFYSLALIGLGGMAGRPALGFAADKYGPWTVMLPTTFVVMLMVCMVSVLKNAAGVVMVSIIYGFASGAWLSLLITALSALATRPGEIGQRTGLALSVASLGTFLTGSAQAGLLSNKYHWARPIGFFAFLLIVSIGIFAYVRHLVTIKRRFVFV
jgi:predicted MFS family arabinose efflux permease